MKSSRPRILLINASLQGGRGNTARLLRATRDLLRGRAEVDSLQLAKTSSHQKTLSSLNRADGFVFATGTHWDSWSSHLQKFLEDMTAYEGTSTWLGKPAACLVTEHSVGGKAVLSRLQGVLNTLGCQLPPMSGLVLSLAGQLAGRAHPIAAKDFWSTDDLEVVVDNLLASTAPANAFRAWPVDRRHLKRVWLRPL